MRTSQDLQVVRCFGQLTLSIFKSYIHNKNIQIIIQSAKSIKELRQCVHNNLLRSFMFPISVGSVPVSWLQCRNSSPLKWESHKTCKRWEIWMTTQRKKINYQQSVQTWTYLVLAAFPRLLGYYLWEILPLNSSRTIFLADLTHQEVIQWDGYYLEYCLGGI